MRLIISIKMLSINLIKNSSLEWGANYIKASGPLGTLVKNKENFSLAVKESKIYLWSENTPKKEATYLSWLNAILIGVTKGYKCKLKLVGVGFRASLKENVLSMKLGYSHEINYEIPLGIRIIISKGKGTLLLIKGAEFQKVNQVAKDIRAYRIPDSYKGKGIHYYNEVLTLKKGKREGK